MLYRLFTWLTVLSVALFMFTACGDDDDNSVDPPVDGELNIVERAGEEDNFTVLLNLVEDLGLTETLTENDYTLLAPSDDAFNNLPEGTSLDQLTEEQQIDLLLFHLIEGSVTAAEISEQQDTESELGELLLLQNTDGEITINNSSNVISSDIMASNGVIHAIDEVLMPSEVRIELGMPNIVDIAVDTDGYETLVSAVERSGLTTTLQFLGPFTAFAPSDEAFAEVDVDGLSDEEVADVLRYHVVEGQILVADLEPEQDVETLLEGQSLFITIDENDDVFVNESAQVLVPDIPASNGIIHSVDQVLSPDQGTE
ncbi:MAG: fasciclin domain-containing protein [Balneolaceae bacterium]